ncbi:putative nuclear polyadenylated RNA-binding protein Nab2/ZC3H14 [Helianthus annuus]|nr:putative nuclear polyadenylated RNA-binding protein Nab2/ZC3H14 [Helianthus annuus]
MRSLKRGGRKEEVRSWMNIFLGNDKDSFVSWLWDHLQSNQDLYAQSKESHPDKVAKQKPQAQQAAVNSPAPQAQAQVQTQPDKPRSLIDTVNYLLCTEPCRNRVAQLRALNSKMMDDYNSVMAKYIGLRENNKILYEKIDALKKDIAQLHRDVNQQQCWVHDYKHRLTVKTLECDSVKGELELLTGKYKQSELNIKKFDTSSDTVRNLCDVQLAYKENKGKGLGYKQVPPPYNHNYSRMPTTEQEQENYDTMIYGKPSDYVPWEPFKPKNARPADFQKPMNFVKNKDKNCSNESAGESEKENENGNESEPVKTSANESQENVSNSDSIDNVKCFSSCAESEIVEEQSVVDDKSHSNVAEVADVADDSDVAKDDNYAWNYVMSSFGEAHGVPTRTDESGAVIFDRDENVFTRKPDVSTEKLDTRLSSDSESHSDGSDNYPSVPEKSDDTSEPREEGSSDEPDSQVADFGTLGNEHSTSENSECVKHSDSSTAMPEENQTVSNIDCSSHKKSESADVKDSEVDEAEEKTFIECISEETHGISKIEEKGSMEINSSVESNEETEEEIFVETFSIKTPENIVSKEKESVEVNSTKHSTCDPKESESE